MFLRTIQKKLARQCRKTARLLKEGKLAAPKGGINSNTAFDDKGNPVSAIGLVLSRAGFNFKHIINRAALKKALKGKDLYGPIFNAELEVYLASDSLKNRKNLRRAVIKPLIALGIALDNTDLRKPCTRTAKPVTSTTTTTTKTAANSTNAFFAQAPTKPTTTQAQV